MPSRYHLSLNDPREPFLVGTPNKVWFNKSVLTVVHTLTL